MARESDFCQFSKFHTVGNTQVVELTFQKYFFTTSISLGFRVADYFLRVSYTSDAYGKCVLTSEQTFKINQSITRQLQLATWQQKAIFVNFQHFTQ